MRMGAVRWSSIRVLTGPDRQHCGGPAPCASTPSGSSLWPCIPSAARSCASPPCPVLIPCLRLRTLFRYPCPALAWPSLVHGFAVMVVSPNLCSPSGTGTLRLRTRCGSAPRTLPSLPATVPCLRLHTPPVPPLWSCIPSAPPPCSRSSSIPPGTGTPPCASTPIRHPPLAPHSFRAAALLPVPSHPSRSRCPALRVPAVPMGSSFPGRLRHPGAPVRFMVPVPRASVPPP